MKATHAVVVRLVQGGLSLCLAFLICSGQLAYAQISDLQLLSSKTEWLNLLHVNHGESEIDAAAFFLASDGKYNPQAELQATVTALMTDETDDDNSIFCRFPARSHWLISQLPFLAEHIHVPSCPKMTALYQQLDPDHLTLIYASAHINSPASAFGHTFLRVDSTAGTPLSAYAINYAAQTTETNGFIYAYQGLFGGYEGKYSMMLYSERLKEYSELEQRDLWEYTLNLSHVELSRLIYHVIELMPFYANYYFTSENCSYNLLWLLQVARPAVQLIQQTGKVVAPIETIRLIQQAGLIDHESYRASSRKRMLQLANDLRQHEKPLFIPVVSNADYDTAQIDDYAVEDKVRTLELTVFDLKRQYSRQEVSDESYKKRLLQLLRVRSTMPQMTDTDISTPESPLMSHQMRRIGIGIKQHSDGQTQLALSGRIAYHDLYDLETGYLPGSFINFFQTELSADKHQINIDQFQAIDIHSYALGDTLFLPRSWQVELGARRIFNHKLYEYLKAGMGYTWGSPVTYGFILMSPGMYYHNNMFYSGTADVGLMTNLNAAKLGIIFSKEWFTSHQQEQRQKAFMTFQISKEMALNTEYVLTKRTSEKSVSALQFRLFFYF